MLNRGRKDKILNMMHRGFVNVCLLFTASGALVCVYAGYNYLRYVRPMRKEMAVKYNEKLLLEGKPLDDEVI